MAAELFVVGLSWRTAPVSLRERMAFRDEEMSAVLAGLRSEGGVDEVMLVSTCNRVEVYGCVGGSDASRLPSTVSLTRSFLANSRRVSAESLGSALYERTKEDAVRHIFSVASALDSMVLGETQILGQIKTAYGQAVREGASGPVLARCLERSFTVAKRIRNETGVSRGAANVSTVAVELAKRVFGDLDGKHVLLVGAGKMSALAARHLRGAGARQLTVTNRSPQRAEALAVDIDGVARDWSELPALLSSHDVVLTSTGASQPVIGSDLMKNAMSRRRYHPMVVVDIAVPRDVDPDVARIDGVYLFDIDDLQRVVSENLRERNREAEEGSAIVDEEVEKFDRWLRQQEIVPTIKALREQFHRIAATEADRVIQQLQRSHTGREREEAIRGLSKTLANKLLHTPLTALKQSEGNGVRRLVRATNRLFDLDAEDIHGETDVDMSMKKNEEPS